MSKKLEIKKEIKACQECLYMQEGANDMICSHNKMVNDIVIHHLDKIKDNCPLPENE